VSLQAIVEAIQELNRRTAFIDSSLKFNEALTYHDVSIMETEGAYMYNEKDNLPAASDSLMFGEVRSREPVKIETKQLTMEDDPAIITPENSEVRLRGCPYLML
jgi:hypothetical protein